MDKRIVWDLSDAIQDGDLETMKLAIEMEPRLLNGDYCSGFAPIQSATETGRMESVRLLIEMGADVNQAAQGNETALHTTATSGLPEICALLLSHDAKTDVFDSFDRTPLMWAAHCWNWINHERRKVAELLVQAGATVDLYSAVCMSDEQTAFRLLKQPSPFSDCPDDLLEIAVGMTSLPILERLLGAGLSDQLNLPGTLSYSACRFTSIIRRDKEDTLPALSLLKRFGANFSLLSKVHRKRLAGDNWRVLDILKESSE